MKRLYWTEPDVHECEVAVRAVGPPTAGRVTTEPILFHPEEGGQPADRGTIGPAAVLEVEIDNGRIIHTLDRPLADGTYVARIDRQRRCYTASRHTAQHILSGIAAERFGLQTVGVHIGLEACTVDFDKKIDWDVAEELERLALDVVTRDVPVETVFGGAGERVRSRFGDIEAEVVRVVQIAGCDRSPCCGAHVATTGRIGLIRIFNLDSKKDGTRVSFLAGRRALEQAQAEAAVLRELRKVANCATSELPSTLQKALERTKELSKEVNRVWSLRLSDLVASADVVTLGSSKVGIHVGDVPKELVLTLAGMLAEAAGGAGMVLSDRQLAISSTTLDASRLLKRVQNEIGGKGGGSPRAANGRVDKALSKEELTDILAKHPVV